MAVDPHIERLLASQSALHGVEYDDIPGVIDAFDTDIDHDAVTHAYAALYTAVGDCVATADENDRWLLPGGDVRDGGLWYDALGILLERQCGAEIVDLFPLAVFRPDESTERRVITIAIARFVETPADEDRFSSILATTSALAQDLVRESSTRDAGLLAVADAIRVATGFGQA